MEARTLQPDSWFKILQSIATIGQSALSRLYLKVKMTKCAKLRLEPSATKNLPSTPYLCKNLLCYWTNYWVIWLIWPFICMVSFEYPFEPFYYRFVYCTIFLYCMLKWYQYETRRVVCCNQLRVMPLFCLLKKYICIYFRLVKILLLINQILFRWH